MIRRHYNPSMRLLDELFNDLFQVVETPTSDVKTPIHDVIENDKEFILELLLAGVSKEDVDIDVENDVLTIKAERKEVSDIKYNRKETYFGKYKRSFILPEDIDKENIDASLVDGILKVIIPKLVDEKKLSKKKIEIK